jgi:hypothetical protein
MEEEGSVPPLPRRVPGATKGSWPATRPARPVLSESVLQRVRAAMDAQPEQAASQQEAASQKQAGSQKQPTSQQQQASSERPASLPRRAAGANGGPRAPAQVARAVPPTSLLEHMPDREDDTAPIPAISGSAGGEIESPPGDETSAESDRAAKAERAKALRAAKAERVVKAELAAKVQRAKANLAEAERAAKADPADAERAADVERAKANLAEAERAAKADPASAERAAEAPADHRPATVRPAPEERRPRQQADGRKALPRRPYRLAKASVLAVVLLAAGLLAVAVFRHVTTATTHDRPGGGFDALKADAATRDLAAIWVFDQVRRDARVSCDPEMCLVLKAHKISQGRLLALESGTADPLGSDVIVVTAAVRSMFGGRLSSVYAPTVIASFGSGNLRITVRAIAPDGAAAYRSALAKDLLDRKASGAQLLQSPLIAASAVARKQLAAGQVDLRLLYTIADMAAQHPVNIVAFGDSAPGASAGIPLRSADLTQTGGPARAGSPAGVRSMFDRLRTQGGTPYPYGRVKIVRLAGGQTVLRIEFAAPSPLGLGKAS